MPPNREQNGVYIGVPVRVIPLWQSLVEWRDPIALVIVGGYFMLIPLLGWVARLMPRLAYRRARQDGGDVYITREGVFVNGMFNTWKQPFAELKQVGFDQKAERLGVVHLNFHGESAGAPGQEAQAKNIARSFN